MLCVAESCYLSRGAGEDARRITRLQAFGPGIALGGRAEACNGQLACVFRNVDLEGARALLQPIDLRILRHDRREATEATADPTCRFDGVRLDCASTIRAKDYRMWVVPEAVARQAGAAALTSALSTGLPEARRADARSRLD
jgi:colicin import membrane protein